MPSTMEKFPWSGHLGLKLLPQLLPHLERVQSSLIFVNIRARRIMVPSCIRSQT